MEKYIRATSNNRRSIQAEICRQIPQKLATTYKFVLLFTVDSGDPKGGLGGPCPSQIFAWPPFAPPSFFGKEFASERVEAAYIARKIFVIYNY